MGGDEGQEELWLEVVTLCHRVAQDHHVSAFDLKTGDVAQVIA